MNADADAIADCVLSTFDRLPEKRKPRPRNDGLREWVPLAGIVLSKGNRSNCIRQAL
jgi:tRNA-specific adenosine deaminase 1